jgi:hypothetical protein
MEASCRDALYRQSPRRCDGPGFSIGIFWVGGVDPILVSIHFRFGDGPGRGVAKSKVSPRQGTLDREYAPRTTPAVVLPARPDENLNPALGGEIAPSGPRLVAAFILTAEDFDVSSGRGRGGVEPASPVTGFVDATGSRALRGADVR